MRKSTIAVVAVLSVAVAYPAAAWYFGKRIETAHMEFDKQLAAIPYLKVVKHEYVRELFGATETMTLEVPTELFRPPSAPEATAAEAPANADEAEQTPAQVAVEPLPPLQITLRTVIRHGPLPGFSVFGAGTADTEIVFDDATRQKLDMAFGGKKPLEVHSVYALFGGGRTTVKSPPFKTSFPGKEEGQPIALSGDGVELVVDFSSGMKQYTMKGGAPRFELADSGGAKAVFAGFKFDGEQQRMFEDEPLLYSGSQRFSIAEISIDPAAEGGAKVRLKDVLYDTGMPVSGEFIDMIAKLGATEFVVGDKNYGPVHYDFTMKHIHARKLVAVQRGLMALYSKPAALADKEQILKALEPLKEPMLELMKANPELVLERLSFRTADGDANIAARVKLAGASAEDFANPLQLVGKIDASAEIALPAALIATLQAGRAQSEEQAQAIRQGSEQMLAGFAQQGYVSREGAMVKTKISYRGGQMLVNGKVFGPGGAVPAQ